MQAVHAPLAGWPSSACLPALQGLQLCRCVRPPGWLVPLPGRLDGRRLQHAPQGELQHSPLPIKTLQPCWACRQAVPMGRSSAQSVCRLGPTPTPHPTPQPFTPPPTHTHRFPPLRVQRPCSWDYRRHGFEPFNEPVDYSQPSGSPSRCSQLCDEDVGGLPGLVRTAGLLRVVGGAAVSMREFRPGTNWYILLKGGMERAVVTRTAHVLPTASARAARCRAVLLQLNDGVWARLARPLPAAWCVPQRSPC